MMARQMCGTTWKIQVCAFVCVCSHDDYVNWFVRVYISCVYVCKLSCVSVLI